MRPPPRRTTDARGPTTTPVAAVVAVLLPLAVLLLLLPGADAHGYLRTPRSRNLVAYQDKNWETFLSGGAGNGDPYPEDCPHCLNRGGTLAQCGVLFGETNSVPWVRNYDRPLDVRGQPLPPKVQGVYQEGATIDVEVMVTTHHKGHFEFAACPVEDETEVPTAECFRRNKLAFVSDELYGAPRDPNHPERAYLAPASSASWLSGAPAEQPVVGAAYKMKLRLPEGVAGDVVLLQWYYLTANSCKHEGYADYPFPEEWGKDVALYRGLPDCADVPADGDGVPEQFWNCAEIKVVGSGGSNTGGQAAPASAPEEEMVTVSAPVPPAPTPPLVAEKEAPGNGSRACADASYSYYEATEDCTGYIHCTMGQPDEPYDCGDGMLYDEAGQRCNWADQVSCAGDGVAAEDEIPAWMPSTSRPTRKPTPQPTNRPNALLDWDPDAVVRGHNKTIIGYYASWQWYDRDGVAAPANMDFAKITRANFAFFQITTEGDIFGTDSWADPITLFGFYDWTSDDPTVPLYCSWDDPKEPPACAAHNYEEGLIYLAHAAGAEVYPSIGGWSLSDPFPAMAADAGARAHFAEQCVELIKSYNFDGIDLDWEYPGYEPHSGTPEDTGNFNLLLDDVRAALDGLEAETGKYYGLTAALPCGPSIIDNQDIEHVGRLLTELNLMTYDFHGSWNDKTGVNAPLYDQEGSPDFSVHGCVANWMEGGAPKDKINIGFPFYGRSFLRAQHLHEAHQGNDDSTWHQDEGVPQYYNILKKKNELTSVRDEQTMTQYAYSSTGMVSYDDERAICDKTEYAQVHGLRGYIIWELSGDLNEDLSTPLLDAANAKLLDPNLDCASLDLSDAVGETISQVQAADAVPEVVWYPDFGGAGGALCLSDGLQPNWLNPSDKFDNLEGCCDKHFSWSEECVQNSQVDIPSEADLPRPDALYYPSDLAHECLSDGKQPEWLLESVHVDVEECCEVHYGWSLDCVANSIATAAATAEATVMATAASVAAPESFGSPILGEYIASDATYQAKGFFPVFDAGTTNCEDVGTPPFWINGQDIKESKGECCRSYAFWWDFDACFLGASSNGDSTNEYYPKFRKGKCRSDGKYPSWQGGDYLTLNEWQCCNNNFHDEELIGQCFTMPACSDCPSEMSDFFDSAPNPVAASAPSTTSATIPATAAATAATTASLDPIVDDADNVALAFSATVEIPTTASAVAAAVEDVLQANKDRIDNEILLYQSPTSLWEPSSVYRFDDMRTALRVMYTNGVANKYFYMGDESENGPLYGLVNIAAFLAQSMKETIKYNACDENSWDLVDGGYPLSNACGQLGQSYQDYKCSESEAHMECPAKKDMEITATTNAKWWGAPAPLFCGPKERYPFTGYWDHSKDCNNAWVDPPETCDVYDGQKGGEFNNDSPSPNSAQRTDVESCCWWGRGVIQTTGVCNFGKLNYYLGARAAEEGRESRYPDIDFCEQPDAVCASQEHKELKWIAGMFYWVESLQSYSTGGWNYIAELKRFVDDGMSGNKFIDAVSGIVNRGCHNPPCESGGVDGSYERASNFLKVLAVLDLVP